MESIKSKKNTPAQTRLGNPNPHPSQVKLREDHVYCLLKGAILVHQNFEFVKCSSMISNVNTRCLSFECRFHLKSILAAVTSNVNDN
jgi:uncharacterized beta-barrel protein YwiB (DUF1934 family)